MVVPLFGAAFAAPNKGTTSLYGSRSPKTALNPPVNGKIQGLFKAFECFPVLFKANLFFKDFSRQCCIFKYFSSLCQPCTNDPDCEIIKDYLMAFWLSPEVSAREL